MGDGVREHVLKAVARKAKLPAGADLETFNYVDSGYVNSIEIIKFVVDIEARFDIELSDDELASPEFKIVGGLISLIERKIAARGGQC